MRRIFRSAMLPLLTLTVMAPLAAAHAATPTLQPGEWQYHADIHYRSGVMATGDLHKDWSVCVTASDAQLPAAMPATPGVQCDKPTLTAVGKAFHSTMTCTVQGQAGMTSTMRENFLITPADGQRRVTIDGTVHQTISGLPVAVPDSVIDVHTTGVRTGDCAATAK